MYNIVLDTNILHQEGLHSNDMSILKNLVDAKLVCVHIPSIIAQEFITKRITSVKEENIKIIKALEAIEKEGRRINTVLYDERQNFIDQIGMVNESIEERAKISFETWVKDFKVNIIHPQQESFSQVFNDYFSGEGVFRQVKARDDIPDAFINICIESLIESVGRLIVIIKDERLKKHLDKNTQIKTLTGLREFFNENGLEKTLANDRITKFILSEEFSHNLVAFLDAEPHYFDYFNEEGDSVHGDTLIGVRAYNINIEIESYDSIENLQLSDVREISPNKFSAICSFTVDSSIGYVTDYGSYLDVTKMPDRNPDCWSVNGDGWCDIIEAARLKFFGDLTIEFSKEYEQIDKINIFNELFEKGIIMSMNIFNSQIEEMIQ
ncbi:PIN domain-containing protein [Cronobacter muytjensii]